MIRKILRLGIIAGVATVIIRTFLVEGIYVASASMEPSLPSGSYYFMEKVSVRLGALERGDIVVFPSPVDEKKDLIKRVIAMPGDTIEIRDKNVYLNNQKVFERYVKHTREKEILDDDNMPRMTVPQGNVFVMGDNRDESGDSRDWKDAVTGNHIYFVPVDKIKGKVLLLY